MRIKLNFQRFSLEEQRDCQYDSVKIYDGDSISAPQLGRREGYCGRRFPSSLTSTGNSILIIFASDASTTSSGFRLTYSGKPFWGLFLYLYLSTNFYLGLTTCNILRLT